MSIIYILSQGHYEENHNVLVTSNMNQVVKKYADIINHGWYRSPFHSPYIEVWVDGKEEERGVTHFNEDIGNEEEIIERLTELKSKITR